MKNWVLTALALLWFSVTAPVQAADAIFIQSTTSTQNSGLLDALLPVFTQDTGITVRVVAVGTGQAIKNAKNGDGDVLLVHSKDDEEVFVKAGWGLKRLDVMYNDFIIIGPRLDPVDNLIVGRASIPVSGSDLKLNPSIYLFTIQAIQIVYSKMEYLVFIII